MVGGGVISSEARRKVLIVEARSRGPRRPGADTGGGDLVVVVELAEAFLTSGKAGGAKCIADRDCWVSTEGRDVSSSRLGCEVGCAMTDDSRGVTGAVAGGVTIRFGRGNNDFLFMLRVDRNRFLAFLSLGERWSTGDI